MRSICCLLLALAFGVHATDAPTKRYFPDNPRLAVLFQEDQDDRHGFPNTKRTYEEINKINERDEARRQEIVAMLGLLGHDVPPSWPVSPTGPVSPAAPDRSRGSKLFVDGTQGIIGDDR
jgi:hypothetical protein